MSVSKVMIELEHKQRLATLQTLATSATGFSGGTVLECRYEVSGYCPPHYHDCDEVLVFLEGEGTLFLGQEPRPVFAGTTLVIPAGTPHCFYNTGIGHVRLLAFLPKEDPEYAYVEGLFTSGPPEIATEEMFAGLL